MTISTDNTNVTIEFIWQDEDTNLQLHVKHFKDDGVPTVAVSEDGSEWYNFPVKLFQEVVEFLSQQKVLDPTVQQRSLKTESKTGFYGPRQQSVKKGGLPVPQVTDAEDIDNQAESQEPMNVANTQPLETFSGVEALGEKTSSYRPKKSKRKTELDEEIPNRPVIRGADENMAKMLRGESSEPKSFRPAHQSE